MKKAYLLLLSIATVISCQLETDNYSSGYPSSNYVEPTDGEEYNSYTDNPFISVSDNPISTFSIDADGGSYANVRRFLKNQNQLPPVSAVRIEEFLNYFEFDYPLPTGNVPIALNGEVAECPWENNHKLMRIGMRGAALPNPRPASNFVFLIDVSGSMSSDDKLGLLKLAFSKLVMQLNANDHISIVTYSGKAGIALQPTSGDNKSAILLAISKLGSGGSTAGAEGIKTAYELANRSFKQGGNNRVILGTDGDFNVGVSSQNDLINLIETKRDEGVFLTVCGVGTGNYHDGSMEQLANHGNGTYEYIDSDAQGEKVFVREFYKFFTVAKDVKVQVTFNPAIVSKYRLIGYENRLLNQQDFEDDSKDAGELGAGQTVTALYQIEPVENVNWKQAEVFTIDFRYKKPTESNSNVLQLAVHDAGNTFAQASESMRFSAGVAAFGMLLRESPFKGTADFQSAKDYIYDASNFDPHGDKAELLTLVDKARMLK